MSKYLFIPYSPTDSEVFEAPTRTAMKRKWLKLAHQSTAKCFLFEFDASEPSGLRLIFSASDGEYSDWTGNTVGYLSK